MIRYIFGVIKWKMRQYIVILLYFNVCLMYFQFLGVFFGCLGWDLWEFGIENEVPPFI